MKTQCEITQSEIKQRAVNTNEKGMEIFNIFVCRDLQNASFGSPKIKSIIDNISRVRRKNNIVINKNEITLPDSLQKSLNN
jgi:hypothetical protein